MGEPDNTNRTFLRDPAARAVVASWRKLTGGAGVRDGDRRTLLACSGGADSSALVLAIGAAVSQAVVVAHVVHDLRPADQANSDRDGAAELARRLGLGFVQRAVSVRAQGGNAEGTARRLRYQALVEMAEEAKCGFVATGHQADDQLETVLMRLMRGAGPRGLRGVRPRRRLSGSVALVRPMLGVTRADCERLCGLAGWSWREDLTNQDEGRLRAAVRAGIIPEMRRLCPGVAQRVSTTAEFMAGAAELIAQRAAQVPAVTDTGAGTITYSRGDLRDESAVVVGEVLRLAARTVSGGGGLDALTWRVVRPAIEAVRGQGTDPRVFRWKGVVVRVDTHRVSISRC